jgi:hypothetical protein
LLGHDERDAVMSCPCVKSEMRVLQRDGATLVFPARKVNRVRSPTARGGLSKKMRFHDMRHTFASHWVLGDGDIFRLSKILGHSSVIVTEKTSSDRSHGKNASRIGITCVARLHGSLVVFLGNRLALVTALRSNVIFEQHFSRHRQALRRC